MAEVTSHDLSGGNVGTLGSADATRTPRRILVQFAIGPQIFTVGDLIAADGMSMSIIFIQEDNQDAFSEIAGSFEMREDGRLSIIGPADSMEYEDDSSPKMQPSPRPGF